MKDPPIRFGTDGWRGIIGRDFTFANVRLVAQATADYFQTVEAGRAAILVGFDVRFLSAAFARATAEVFAGNGFETLLLDRVCPTPQISFEVRNRGLRGGIVITASHNPSEFNGFKVKSHYGGSATEEVTVQIEQRLGTSPVRQSDRIASVAPSDAWFGHLRSLVDWPAIERSGLVICADAMHGSGGTLLEALLRPTNCQVHSLRSRPDPLFGGISPEPMLPALEPLSAAVLAARADIGLATDGDADRLGVVAGDGRFVSTLEVLPLLLLHAYRNRGWRGAVVRTFSQSQLVDRIASSLALECHETPIGFKNIARIMLEKEVLIGGEESGGIGLSRHLPERDGLFLELLLLDLLAGTGKSLTRLIREMWNEFGEFHYLRQDLHIPAETGMRLLEELAVNPPDLVGNKKVKDVRTLDGVKLILEPDAWILFRRSGTEPVLRIYCESPEVGDTRRILAEGRKLVEQFRPSGVSSM